MKELLYSSTAKYAGSSAGREQFYQQLDSEREKECPLYQACSKDAGIHTAKLSMTCAPRISLNVLPRRFT